MYLYIHKSIFHEDKSSRDANHQFDYSKVDGEYKSTGFENSQGDATLSHTNKKRDTLYPTPSPTAASTTGINAFENKKPTHADELYEGKTTPSPESETSADHETANIIKENDEHEKHHKDEITPSPESGTSAHIETANTIKENDEKHITPKEGEGAIL